MNKNISFVHLYDVLKLSYAGHLFVSSVRYKPLGECMDGVIQKKGRGINMNIT